MSGRRRGRINLKNWGLCWLLVCCVARFCLGGPLEHGEVSAEAKWLAHIDLQGVKQSEAAKLFAAHVLSRPEAQLGLREVRERLGVDLLEDVVDVTIYGTSYRADAGVALFEVAGDRQRLVEYLRGQPEYNSSAQRTWTLHHWIQDQGQPDQQTLTVALDQGRRVLFGRQLSQVRAALDVLDGQAKSLTAAESSLKLSGPAGTTMQAVATALSGDDVPFKSPVLRQSERFALFLGERDGLSFAHGEVLARSEEVATQMRAVLLGMVALGKIQSAQDPRVLALAEPLVVRVQGRSLSADWQGQAGATLAHIEQLLRWPGGAQER